MRQEETTCLDLFDHRLRAYFKQLDRSYEGLHVSYIPITSSHDAASSYLVLFRGNYTSICATLKISISCG